jgi:hypothetical protein
MITIPPPEVALPFSWRSIAASLLLATLLAVDLSLQLRPGSRRL